MTDARCACLPFHPEYFHCKARVRMAYYYVYNGHYPMLTSGASNLEDLLFHCKHDWYLSDRELSEVEAMWYEDHPVSDDSTCSDDSSDDI